MPSSRAALRAAPAIAVVEVAAVELVVAGDEDDRLRPAAKALEARPSGCRCRRRGRAARRRAPARGRTLGLEVQVGEQLQAHQAGVGGAVALLELAAAAARAGIVAADLGRRAAHRLDLVAQRQRSGRTDRRRRRRPRRSRRRATSSGRSRATSAATACSSSFRPAGSGYRRASVVATASSSSSASPAGDAAACSKPATHGSSGGADRIERRRQSAAASRRRGGAPRRRPRRVVVVGSRMNGSKLPYSAIERFSAAWRRRISARARRCSGDGSASPQRWPPASKT